MYSGIFLAFCLHLMPVVVRYLVQAGCQILQVCVLLISLLFQAVKFLVIVANSVVGLLLFSPLSRGIYVFSGVTMQCQQIPNSSGNSKHQTYLLSLEKNK